MQSADVSFGEFLRAALVGFQILRIFFISSTLANQVFYSTKYPFVEFQI
jgi:hypothetical protein